MKTWNNYPLKVSSNAEFAYFRNLEKKTCNNQIGVKTAIILINRSELNLKMIKKIYSYLSRAAYYVGDDIMCGFISYNLWGGLEMHDWAKKILKEQNDN